MDDKNFNVINITNENLSPLIQILLLFAFSIKKNTLLVFLIIISKYIPLLIVTCNYSIGKTNNSKDNSFIIQNFLSNFCLSEYIFNLKYKTYFTISSFVFILEIIFVSYLIKYYYFIKKRKTRLELYPKILFYLNAIFSSYIIEFLSMIGFLFFKTKLNFKEDSKFSNSNFILEKNPNYTLIIIFLIIHIIEFLFLEVFIFISFIILNDFHKTQKNKLNFKNSYYFLFFNFFTLLNYASYSEIFVKKSHHTILQILIFIYIFILLTIKIGYEIFIYERINLISLFIYYLDVYNYISLILQTVINIKTLNFEKYEIYFITFLKIILSLLCTIIILDIRNYFFCHQIFHIFIQYDSQHLLKIMNFFHFFLDKLYDIKSHQINYFSEIIYLLYYHKKKCVIDDCKCKFFEIIPDWNINNIYYSDKLIDGLGFILESTFANIQIYSNFDYIIFMINYFNSVKKNQILALSMIRTYILKNIGNISIFESFQLYSIYYQSLVNISKNFEQNERVIKYENIFINIKERIKFRNKVHQYCNAFNSIIDIKINFENTLKITTDQSNELISVNSYILNKTILVNIIQHLCDLFKISTKVQKNLIQYCSGKKGADFYYQIFLFFTIFYRNIPEEILLSFNKFSEGNSFKNLTFEEMTKKFDKIIEKYLQKGIDDSHIILSFSEGVKIDYCSSNLCNKLNISPSKIRNQDFHNFFPYSLREPHLKAMLHYLVNNNHFKNFFFERNRFIFDNEEHSIPCRIKTCNLPYLSKNIVIINEIYLREKDDSYTFILNNNFQGVSISNSFQNNYHFTLDMLRKSDTPLRYIFNLHKHSIQKFFKDKLDVVEKIKKKLDYNIRETFTQSLYNLNKNSINSFFEIKNKFKKENLQNFTIKHEDLSLLYKKETFKFSIQKNIILENIMKSLNKLSDTPMKEIFINLIIEDIINKKENREKHNLPSKRMSAFNFGFLPESNNSIIVNLYGKLKVLYDIPLYYFHFKESKSFEKNISIFKRGSVIFKTNSSKKSLLLPISQKTTMNQIIRFDDKSENNENENKYETKKFMVSNNSNYNIKYTIKSEIKKKKNNEYSLLLKLDIILILICFILSISSVIYKEYKVDKINIMGKFYIESHFLYDKISYIFTIVMGELYELGNITTKEANITLLNTNLKINLNYLVYAKQQFYISSGIYDKKVGKDRMNDIYGLFKKNTLTWEIHDTFSDIYQELYSIIFLASQSLIKTDLTLFYIDFHNLWFKNYINNINSEINTNLVQLVYHFINNQKDSYDFIFDNLKKNSYNDLIDFLNSSRLTVIIVLISWLLFNISFFVASFIILYKFHKIILIRIVSLFFINNKVDKSSIKSRTENYYMKEKIRLFVELVYNFSIDIKYELQTLQNNFVNKCCKNNETTLYGISTIYPLADFPFEEINKKDLNENYITKHNSTNNITTNLSYSLNATGDNLLNNSHLLNNINLKQEKNNPKKLKQINFDKQKKQNNEKKTNFKKKEKKYLIPTENVIHRLTKRIIIFSHIMLISLILLFIISLLMVYLQYYMTYYYNERISFLIYIFKIFVEYFHEIPDIFNRIRMFVLLHEPFPFPMEMFVDKVKMINKEISYITSSNKFKYFSDIKYLWDQIELPINSSDFNGSFLCNNVEICVNVLQGEKSYFSDGIRLGYQLLIQSFFAIIIDYNNLNSVNKDFNTDDIIQILSNNDFNSLQKNVDIVLSEIQNAFYNSYLYNYAHQKKYLSLLTSIFNYIFFIFQISIIFIIILWMGYYISKKSRETKKGARLFKFAFFKDSGIS